MSPTPPTLRILDALSAALLCGAGAIGLWPVEASLQREPARAKQESQVVLPLHLTDASDDAGVIVSANIMSGSRHAPSVRYASPDLVADASYAAAAPFARIGNFAVAATDSAATDSADTAPALYGIVNMRGVWHALIRLSPTDLNPALLKDGDKRGAYRVVTISADRVLVSGPDGQHTLRLSRGTPPVAPHRDSTGNNL